MKVCDHCKTVIVQQADNGFMCEFEFNADGEFSEHTDRLCRSKLRVQRDAAQLAANEWERKAEFAAANYRRRNLEAQQFETALRQAKDALMHNAGEHSHSPGCEDPRVNIALDAIIAALET